MNAPIPMIDVSSNNHLDGNSIQWTKVRTAKYGAVMVKCSEGASYVNPWCKEDATEAHAAGIGVGFYHFAHPGLADPSEDAQNALEAIAGLPRIHGLALDYEVTEGLTWAALDKWARAWYTIVDEHVDHAPLYCDDDFLTNLHQLASERRLWIAQTARPRFECWAWQIVGPTVVPGIVAPTDVGWLHPTT